jgi:uncharacterized membrane protein
MGAITSTLSSVTAIVGYIVIAAVAGAAWWFGRNYDDTDSHKDSLNRAKWLSLATVLIAIVMAIIMGIFVIL